MNTLWNAAKVAPLFFFWLTFFFAHNAQAQEEQVVDKIIAKIDNQIILLSDLENAYIQVMASGQNYGKDVRCEIMRQLLIDKVLLAQAEIDSIFPGEANVELELEQRMQYFIMEAGGDPKVLEQQIGKSIEDLKDDLRAQVREQLTVREMRRTISEQTDVTPKQVKEFFEAIPKDSLPTFPTEYEIAQITKIPEVNEEEKKRVRDELLALRKRVLDGKDFGELAQLYSEDYSSARLGGDLGFQSRGKLVPEFEATVYRLDIGEISEPIESPFGFHIIQLLERQGNRFHSRHILMRPEPSDKDIENAQVWLDSIRGLIVSDSLTFAQAAKKFSDDEQVGVSGGFITSPTTGKTRLTADELDYATFKTIEELNVGEVSKPAPFRQKDGEEAVRMIFFKAKHPAHKASLEKDYEKLRQFVINKEKNESVEAWFLETMRELYISIDPEYDRCNLTNGL